MSSDLKISQLPQITQAQDSDLLPIVDSGVTCAITRADLLAVQDSLDSTDTGDPLSAHMGSVLYALIVALQSQMFGKDTFANLKMRASAAPTTPFMCYATDTATLYMYVGDTGVSDGGFVAVNGAAANSPEVG
jgi:hypothetical protein